MFVTLPKKNLVSELEFDNYRTEHKLSDELIEQTEQEQFVNETNF